jgi:hypothetical protein
MNNKSTYTQYKSLDKGKKYSIGGGIIVFLIAISPYLFYLYESFPNDQVWETSFFTLETSYPSMYQFANNNLHF